MKQRTLLFAAGLLAAALATAPADAAKRRAFLSGPQIKGLLSGQIIHFQGPHSGVQWYDRTGNTAYQLKSGEKAQGRWRVADNKLCTEFTTRKPRVVCYKVWRIGRNNFGATGGYTMWRLSSAPSWSFIRP